MEISRKKILLFYIETYPVWDIVYSLTNTYFGNNININQIVRMIGVLFILSFIREIRSYFIIAGVSIFGLTCVFINMSRDVSINFMTDVTWLIKLVSGLIIYLSFKEIFNKNIIDKMEVFEALRKSLIFVIVSILLSYVGLGYYTYNSSNRFGVKGLFAANNTITEYLVILYMFQYLLLKGKKRIIMILLTIIATMSIGTKMGIIGICTLTIMLFYINAIGKKKGKIITSRKKFAVLLVVGIIGLIVAVIIFNKLIESWVGSSMTKMYNVSFYGYLVSNRNWQISAIDSYFVKDKLNLITGVGYSRTESVLKVYHKGFRAIEQDFHAIYYYFGIVLFLIFVVIIGIILYKIVRVFFKSESKLDRCVCVSIVVAFIGGLLGGHLILEALSQMPFWILCAYISSIWKMNYTKIKIRL